MIFTNWHMRFLKRFLFLLIPYSFLRIGFYFYHRDIYQHFDFSEILTSFLIGIRFDIAAICLINIPIILLSLIPSNHPLFIKFERLLFTLINTCGFIVSVDDYELFLFMGKRLSYDFFVITDDILDQIPQVALYYWYLPLAGILLSVAVYFFDKRFFNIIRTQASKLSLLLGGFLLLVVSFIGIRGGLQHKSINVQSAFIQGRNELGHLVLNTPYHFIRTLKNQSIVKLKFFKNDKEAKELLQSHRSQQDFKGMAKANVVLIILESFSLEYMESGYTPFLERLKERSLFFERHLANGRRSIEVLPSLLCGLPSLLEEPVSKSIFQGNKFFCMPDALKSSGYTNYFFHAGSRGTMGFESYTLSHGFDRYFSREDYPGDNDFDGTWGIYDGPYLQYVAKKIDEMPEPFLAGVFTLSSHQPYAIPFEYRDSFPKGPLEIHESIGYADFALAEFFKSIQHKPWFKNTLFVITSDHTQKLETKKHQNLLGHYRVPLLFFAPAYNWKDVRTSKVTQHSDIPHSILDFVEVEKEKLPLTGASVFNEGAGIAVNYAGGSSYFMVLDDKVLTLSKSFEQKSFYYDWSSGEMVATDHKGEKTLMAYLQYFLNGLINNNLSL